MLITFDFGGASLCHEILHFVQKSLWETAEYQNPFLSTLAQSASMFVRLQSFQGSH
uniref:Uncharacterized protein n=1 Tax=Candidatus Kentrum sp. LPFa TaxID=2126335 RepID=A0A450WYX4_9GAMM|nr:MAG: hypothetical protein BECKLPF1236A_GA0070988_103366 [Candidatus Kentron sp. LPFa]